jgi:hypothetical protein
MGAHPNGLTALGVGRDDCFCRKLPILSYVGQPGIDCGRCLLSAGCVECKFNEWNELIERLILRKLTGCVSARQIERAVLDRETPMQRIGIAGRDRGELPSPLVNAKIGRCVRHRMFQRHRAGDGKWAKPLAVTQSTRATKAGRAGVQLTDKGLGGRSMPVGTIPVRATNCSGMTRMAAKWTEAA